MPMKNPPHPGDLIRTEIIEALGLSISEAAEILKVRRATLSDLLNRKAALSTEMALRIEKAFGPEMDHLLRMQLAYDVAKIRGHQIIQAHHHHVNPRKVGHGADIFHLQRIDRSGAILCICGQSARRFTRKEIQVHAKERDARSRVCRTKVSFGV